MRSRYSAFVRGNADYLWRTLHRDHEARADGERAYKDALQARPDYRALRVVESAEGDHEGIARVLFVVRYRSEGKAHMSAELSFFAQENGSWRYVDGILTDPKAATSIAAVEGP